MLVRRCWPSRIRLNSCCRPRLAHQAHTIPGRASSRSGSCRSDSRGTGIDKLTNLGLAPDISSLELRQDHLPLLDIGDQLADLHLTLDGHLLNFESLRKRIGWWDESAAPGARSRPCRRTQRISRTVRSIMPTRHRRLHAALTHERVGSRLGDCPLLQGPVDVAPIFAASS